jgi:large subunit ribosomal protein L17
LGTRPGDNAERALIELVDFNEVYGKSAAKTEEAATKRTRRGSKKTATVATEEKQTPATPVVEVTPTVESVEETKTPE